MIFELVKHGSSIPETKTKRHHVILALETLMKRYGYWSWIFQLLGDLYQIKTAGLSRQKLLQIDKHNNHGWYILALLQ